jgi:hypothetical protein
VQHLTDREEPDHHLDERDSAEEVDVAEGEARVAEAGGDPDRGDEQSGGRHHESAGQRAAREADDDDEAEDHDGEVLDRPEVERQVRQGRRERHEQRQRDDGRDERADRADGERRSGFAVLRHLIAVQRRDDARRLSRCGDQHGRDRASVLGAVVDAGEHDERGDGLERERERDEDGDTGGGTEPGHEPDDGAEEHTDEAPQQVLRGEGRGEAEDEVVDHGGS